MMTEDIFPDGSGRGKRPFDSRIKKLVLIAVLLLFTASCGASLAKRKEDSDVHYRLGVVYLGDKNYSEALKEFTTAIEKYPDDPSYHNGLGLAYFARNMHREAVGQFHEAVKIDPKFSDAYLHLSAVYLTERRWDDAIEAADKAIANIFYRTPEYAQLNKGIALYNKGEFKAAFDSFKKAVDLNSSYAPAYYHMGITLDKLNLLREAVEALQTAIKLDDSYVDAHYGLGLVYIKLKSKAEALKEFERVIALSPQTDRAASATDYINLLK